MRRTILCAVLLCASHVAASAQQKPEPLIEALATQLELAHRDNIMLRTNVIQLQRDLDAKAKGDTKSCEAKP